jgi:hypothetical protein
MLQRANVIRQASEATLRVMCREEVGQSLQGRVRFLLQMRSQYVNDIDRSSGSFAARWRGLGIFAVAQLTRLPDKHVQTLLDPICGIAEGISTPKIDRVYLSQVPQTKSAYNDVSSKKTKVYLYLAFQESRARCPLTRYYRKPKSSTR